MNDKDRSDKMKDREEGKAPVNQGGNPSPGGQDEPRNKEVSKETI